MKRRYRLDKTGYRIDNIAYDDYVGSPSLPKNAVKVPVSADYSAEKNTDIIFKIIDSTSLAGGGTIYIPRGRYRIHNIELKSNICLFIEKGAELIFPSFDEANEKGLCTKPVIYANNAENISITGGGVINGNGESYTNESEVSEPMKPLEAFNTYERVINARKRIRFPKSEPRPRLIHLTGCRNVEISDIILKNSPSWTCCIDGCTDVSIHNIVIDNNIHSGNTDGIDIVGSTNVEIHSSFIAGADDGVCIKTFSESAKNIYVHDMTVISFANSFKIGTETGSEVKDIRVENCFFTMPENIVGGYAGIAIESADGANVSGVSVKNIEMSGVSSPFLIWLGCRLREEKNTPGSVKNIRIENISATDTELPCAVTGCCFGGEVYRPEDIMISNLKAVYRNTGEDLDINDGSDERAMDGYPEITRILHQYINSHEESDYFDLPAYGLFARHVKNLKTESFDICPRDCNKREKNIFIDCI
ncbi:MAG: hypothetical protein K5761_07060 [Clostridiales bacterium]|nr:hypothetical protein [Clostridiales bacterium]